MSEETKQVAAKAGASVALLREGRESGAGAVRAETADTRGRAKSDSRAQVYGADPGDSGEAVVTRLSGTHANGGGNGTNLVLRSGHWWWSGAGVCFLAVVVATVAWGLWAGPLTVSMSVGSFAVAGIAGILAGTAGWFVATRRIARARRTAEDLARLIRAAQDPSEPEYQFDNPHLVTCWQVLGCHNDQCITAGRRGMRCWQLQQALQEDHPRSCDQRRELGDCRSCKVFRLSCPDDATEAAEELNNMLFLVRSEAERQRANQKQMAESEKMAAIGQMAAGVAHEIGNPLASISALVQLLHRRVDGDWARDKLALIHRHVDRISRIVRGMSDFSRPGPRRQELFGLDEVIREVAKLAQFDRRSRGVQLEWGDEPTRLHIFGIKEEVLQVFLNIVYNAFDAMNGNGRLTIATGIDVDHLTVSFRDTGSGVPPEALPHVFEPFFTTKELGKGTGLGLAVSARIMHEHGGRIVVERNGSAGTTVHVRLPIDRVQSGTARTDHRCAVPSLGAGS